MDPYNKNGTPRLTISWDRESEEHIQGLILLKWKNGQMIE